jgi:hypothetical protein
MKMIDVNNAAGNFCPRVKCCLFDVWSLYIDFEYCYCNFINYNGNIIIIIMIIIIIIIIIIVIIIIILLLLLCIHFTNSDILPSLVLGTFLMPKTSVW